MAVIYFVEDDESIRELVLYALKNSGYDAMGFADGESFWNHLNKLPDLVLLDIMLPEGDGLHLLQRMRDNSHYLTIPVIMLTAKTSEYDKVRALDAGADDYITKPFGVMELLSRIRAVLRRTAPQKLESSPLQAGTLVLDEARRHVCVGNMPITLTYKEFELLLLLMRNKGLVLSREKIMECVWGFDYAGESRTVDMHIKTLRQKLGNAGNIIETVRGIGYKLESPE